MCLCSSFEYFGKQMDNKNFELNNIHFQNLVFSICSCSLLLLWAHILIQNWTSDYADSGFKRNIEIRYQVFIRLWEYRIPLQTFHERRMQSTPNQYMMKNLNSCAKNTFNLFQIGLLWHSNAHHGIICSVVILWLLLPVPTKAHLPQCCYMSWNICHHCLSLG